MERLQKVLARAGVASRRKSEKLIEQGRVKVNDKVVTKLGTKVDPERDRIKVDDKEITIQNRKVYILLNKPVGYITTMKDPQGRKTIADLVSSISQRVYPIGRLDYDTEGLLLLTNDGELAYRLMHPSYEVKKTYLALVKGHPHGQALNKLRQGVQLEDGITAPAQVNILKKFNDSTLLEMTIHEGRNRQVRRMCAAVGYPVLKLKRIRLGAVNLGKLKPGRYRPLTLKEVENLKKLVKLK